MQKLYKNMPAHEKSYKHIKHIYKHFDRDGDGELSRWEFRRALDEYERKQNRTVNGVVVALFVTVITFSFEAAIECSFVSIVIIVFFMITTLAPLLTS